MAGTKDGQAGQPYSQSSQEIDDFIWNHPDCVSVCGSVLGDGNSPTMGGAIQGTAPKSKLVVQSLLDQSGGLGGIPADLHDLFKPPYDNDKVRVQTNSWKSTTSYGIIPIA
jgi:hypothetical protein